MKIASLIVRILFGAAFVVFGLNLFLGFIPMPPMQGNAGAFMGVLFTTKFLHLVKVLEIVFGALLIAGLYPRIALMVLTPITVNILLFHTLIAGGEGAGMGFFLLALNIFLLYGYKEDLKGIFKQK